MTQDLFPKGPEKEPDRFGEPGVMTRSCPSCQAQMLPVDPEKKVVQCSVCGKMWTDSATRGSIEFQTPGGIEEKREDLETYPLSKRYIFDKK